MSTKWGVGDLDLAALDWFASSLAILLTQGDVIALSGELGAGKTTFARSLVTHIAGAELDIPSPTFALVQQYDTPRVPLTHIDCYRLNTAEEADELGLDDAISNGIVLIEWPGRIADYLPADHLELIFEDTETDNHRRVTAIGHGGWARRLDRFQAMVSFLTQAGWADAQLSWLQGDASSRSYARLKIGDQRGVLMNAPKMPDGPVIHDGRPYSAIARLAEDVHAFVAVANALRDAGLSAPEILAHDMSHGFLVIEDLGDRVFGAEISAGGDEALLYTEAVEALITLRLTPVPEGLPLSGGNLHILPPYDRAALEIEIELLLDWFWPLAHGAQDARGSQTQRDEFHQAWEPLFEFLETEPEGWVLRDFHSPNLIWLPKREGVRRVGIIDFQDAVRGPGAYDLVSLCQDARRDVTAALEADLLSHYCERVTQQDSAFDQEQFRTAYAILGAQRNTKILGIFARLSVRDGKSGYLAHIPRVSAYLERNLAHPALRDLRSWFDACLPGKMRSHLSPS